MPILILTNQGPKKTGRCLGFLEECIHTDTVEYHRYRPRLSTVSVCLSAPVPSPLFFFPFVQRRILGKTGLDTASLNPVGGLYIEVDLNSFICIMIILREKKTFLRESGLSFAEPMLSNNCSCEDSFTTCQITPNYHGCCNFFIAL